MLSSKNNFHMKIFALNKHIEYIRFSWFQFQFALEKFSPYLVGFHFGRKTLNCRPSSPVWPDLGELEQTLISEWLDFFLSVLELFMLKFQEKPLLEF